MAANPFLEMQFPPQIAYGAKGGGGWSTTVTILSGGYEDRNANWQQSRGKWNVTTGLKTDLQLRAIQAFLHVCQGRDYGFRFKDFSDYSVLHSSTTLDTNITEQGTTAGAVDGVNKVFQLQKVYSLYSPYTLATLSYTRPIAKPVNNGTWEAPIADPAFPNRTVIPVTMYDNGVRVASSTFTVDYTTGKVTFGTAPLAAHTITADFEFDVPCRFQIDQMEFEMIEWNTNRVPVPVWEIRLP